MCQEAHVGMYSFDLLLRAVNLVWIPVMCYKVISINTCVITGNELGMDLWVALNGLCMVIT
jgi:hypothetical protein